MSYTINNYDGTLLTTIVDDTKDTTTSLTLAGPNFVGYGQFLNENLVYLLENFAGNTAPAGTNLQGQLWFNKSTQTLEVFTTQGYVPVSGVILQNSQPINAIAGTTWYDTGHNQYYMFDGTTWNLIGPNYTKQEGVSGAIPAVLNDAVNIGTTHNVLLLQFGTTIFGILNGDPSFTATPGINGFPTIFRGLTLNNNLFPGNNQFYTNANAAAYLPTDPTIIGIDNSLANLSASIASTNANLVATNTAWQANATSQETQISGLSANIISVNNSITVAWTANAATQQNQINTLIAGAYANANTAAYLSTNTGQITAPTLPYNTSNTAVATTAFVQSVFPTGMIMMWNSTAASIPTGFQLCDGTNGTPDLRGQFILGAGGAYSTGNVGGSANVTLTINNLPAHTHTFGASVSGNTALAGGHTHAATTSAVDTGHNHTISDPGHSHTTHFNRTSKSNNSTPYMLTDPNVGENLDGSVNLPTSTSSTGVSSNPAAASISATTNILAVTDHTHIVSLTASGVTSSVGSATAVNTLPPYYALCYIQKMF